MNKAKTGGRRTQQNARRLIIVTATIVVHFLVPRYCRAAVPFVIECGTGSDVADLIEQAIYDGDSFIQLTRGDCMVASTVLITNQEGLRIEGEGRGRTRLVWDSTDPGTMFSIQNSSGVRIAHLSMTVTNDLHLVSAVDMYNACIEGWIDPLLHPQVGTCFNYSPDAGPGSHGNSIHDVWIYGGNSTATVLEYGVRVLLHPRFDPALHGECGQVESDCNNHGHVFDEVHVTKFREAGWLIEGLASVGNTFTHSHCRGVWNTFFEHGTEIPDEECCARHCVRTGRQDASGNDIPNTSGSFSWFGGLAGGVSEAVFQIGQSAEKINISGLYTERSRALIVGGGDGDTIEGPGGVHIESSYFNSDFLNDWHEGSETNDEGRIVDVRGVGPLTMYNNQLGYHLDPENLSLCWSDPADSGSDISSFVFTGNAIGSRYENPFEPMDGEGCLYPTELESNLHAKANTGRWEAMPQSFTVFNTGNESVFSVNRHPTSHAVFWVEDGGEGTPWLHNQ